MSNELKYHRLGGKKIKSDIGAKMHYSSTRVTTF